MTKPADIPFALDGVPGPRLGALIDYWRGLLRGEATMPFADDLDMAEVEAAVSDAFVLGVFERPLRFRLDLAATPNATAVGDLAGRFLDEVDLPPALAYVRSQAEATVESGAPTLYRHRTSAGAQRPYARLLLPTWGEGHIKLLVGGIEWR